MTAWQATDASDGAYAYLLGLYLGDGYVATMPRTFRLRVTLDDAYPGIVAEAAAAIRAVRGPFAVSRLHRDGCIELGSYWKLWPVVFPQHGPGRKHTRRIALATWQRTKCRRAPRAVIRGLLHTDGSRYVASQLRRDRRYTHARYSFSNRSEDIKEILCEHLDLLGIRWTRPNAQQIAIATRLDVSRLDAFVGPKS